MAHSPILAGWCFVLEDDIKLGAVLLVLVRPPHQVDDLVALNRAGSGKHGIGADAGQVIHFKGQNFSGLGRCDSPLCNMVSCMNIASK